MSHLSVPCDNLIETPATEIHIIFFRYSYRAYSYNWHINQLMRFITYIQK
jgi:hypothetical protein